MTVFSHHLQPVDIREGNRGSTDYNDSFSRSPPMSRIKEFMRLGDSGHPGCGDLMRPVYEETKHATAC